MRRTFLALIACCSLMPAAFAQEPLPAVPSVVETATQAPTVYHSGWAVLDANGNLSGRVVTVGTNGGAVPQGGASIELLSPTGAVGGTTDQNGNFSLPGVAPGVYELRSASSTSYAAHGVHVISHQPGAAADLSVFASSIAPSKAEEILRTLSVPQTAQAAPAYGPLVEPQMPIAQSNRVALSDGVINGRLAFTLGYGAPQAHTVKLLRNGQVIDTANVDSMGLFSVRPQGAGAYDVIVGGIGHGVVGVEVVDTAAKLTSTKSDSKLVSVSTNMLVQNNLMIPIAMPGSAPEQAPMMIEEFAGPPPIGGGFPAPGGFAGGGGFSGGGGSGGGGFGGGFGGAGGLLGVAGLALGAAALADDDDGFNGNMATPVAP